MRPLMPGAWDARLGEEAGEDKEDVGGRVVVLAFAGAFAGVTTLEGAGQVDSDAVGASEGGVGRFFISGNGTTDEPPPLLSARRLRDRAFAIVALKSTTSSPIQLGLKTAPTVYLSRARCRRAVNRKLGVTNLAILWPYCVIFVKHSHAFAFQSVARNVYRRHPVPAIPFCFRRHCPPGGHARTPCEEPMGGALAGVRRGAAGANPRRLPRRPASCAPAPPSCPAHGG